MNGINWIFFDLGSTIIDESECYRQRVLKMIQNSNVSYDEFYSVMMSYYCQGQKGDKLAAKEFGFRLTVWESKYESLFPDAPTCLEMLSKEYRLGIIANQVPGTKDRLRKFRIDRYFDIVIASAEEGMAKPDPEIFRLALSRAGCSPEQAVMTGDRLDNDISPANLLGFTTVRMMRGFGKYSSPVRADEFPDYTVNDMNELCEIFLYGKAKREQFR